MTRFTEHKTSSGRVIKTRPNYTKKHFTIKTDVATYRTYELNDDEFLGCEYNTGNDWNEFLKRSDDYYLVRLSFS